MADGRFDDRQIQWCRLDGLANLEYTVLSIDAPRLTADVPFRFAGDGQIALHRHLIHVQSRVAISSRNFSGVTVG